MLSGLHDIKLTATESNWRLFMVRKGDAGFQAFQDKVFQRDQHICQYCGFQSKHFMEVLNRDGNYRRNQIDNLLTTCPLCAQCFFLEAVGRSDFGGGSLIYLPEMNQGELNGLCHVLFASLITNSSFNTETKNIYRSLKLRTQPLEKELGEGMSNPAMYGQMLVDGHHEERYALHEKICEHARVLPDLHKFARQVETWALDSFSEMAKI